VQLRDKFLREGDEMGAAGVPAQTAFLPFFSAFLSTYQIRQKNQTEGVETA
jgi:hypothetical protein